MPVTDRFTIQLFFVFLIELPQCSRHWSHSGGKSTISMFPMNFKILLYLCMTLIYWGEALGY